MILANINRVDALLGLFLLLWAVSGCRRGFLAGFWGFLHVAGSLAVAWWWYRPMAAWVFARGGLPTAWANPAAFVLLGLLGGVLLKKAGHALFKAIPPSAHRHLLNRALGIVPGLAYGGVVAVAVVTMLVVVPLTESSRQEVMESRLAGYLGYGAERAALVLTPVFEDALAEAIRLSLPAHSEADHHSLLFPLRVTDPQPCPALEQRMLELINHERAAVGLGLLRLDAALTALSRRHSEDMLVRRYFSHDNPDRKGPFDRLREAGVQYLAAGENLALARSIVIAHAGLMKSPGHRRNILQARFGRVGIGIMDGGIHGLMITETFRD